MGGRFLDYVKPVCKFCPGVKPAERRIPLREKLLWTAYVLFAFLIFSQIPLYGVASASSADPFYWLRVVMASQRGTLMELGITPIITSGMVVQLLVGSKLIDVDLSLREDRELYEGFQKIVAICITLGEAFIYVWSGMYGPPLTLGIFTCFLIIAQLFITGILILLLDDLMQAGYGMGSGISLFIATNICETIVWKSFSPTTMNTGGGAEFEGAIIALFHLLLTRSSKYKALKEAFTRQNMPNLTNLLATFFVFLAVVYLQGWRIEIPVKNVKARGAQGTYPIKMFYTSNIPIILQSALVQNVYFISQLLFKKMGHIYLIRLLGVWKTEPGMSIMKPVAGLAYYISPPRSLTEVVQDPLHFLVYTCFFLTTCAIFARTWIEVSGSSPRDVARQFRDQNLVIPGHRSTQTSKVLHKYIPIAASFGGVMIGMLSITADLLGAIGSGTGILMAVTILYGYYELLRKEIGANVVDAMFD
eukprot:g2893.t1